MKLSKSKKGLLIGVGAVGLIAVIFNNCARPFIDKSQLNSKSTVDESEVVDDRDIDDNSPPPPNPTYTYSQHIKPLIQNRCVQCHQAGGIGPFPLLNYTHAKAWGTSMLQSMEDRYMPPWGAKDDGSCQSFHDSMWLSTSEISVLKTWVSEKFPEGPPTADIVPPSQPTHYNVSASNVIEYPMPVSYQPPTGGPIDDYRCFLTKELNTDQLVTGFDFVAGNPDVVHHAIIFIPSTEADESAAAAKGQGYSCPAGPGVNNSVVGFWAPGTGPTSYPVIQGKQTGVRIPAGRKLVMQIHYNYSQARVADRSAIRFKISTGSIVKEGQWLSFGKTGGSGTIPAGQVSYNRVETSQVGAALGNPTTNSVPGYIYAVFPHMHQLGSKIKIELNRNATYRGSEPSNECLVDVPVWDFHWQRVYWFKDPVPGNILDSMRMTCTYNTSKVTTPTQFGEASTDEMCFMFAFVTDAEI